MSDDVRCGKEALIGVRLYQPGKPQMLGVQAGPCRLAPEHPGICRFIPTEKAPIEGIRIIYEACTPDHLHGAGRLVVEPPPAPEPT